MNCPLCLSTQSRLFFKEKARFFHRCNHCDLIFLDDQFYLSETDEKKRYDLHDNNPEDPAYVAFLMQLIKPIKPYLNSNMTALDFGSGIGRVIESVLKGSVKEINSFDPFYLNKPSLLTKQYNIITATEVVEHLKTPAQVFEHLKKMLLPDALLGRMTKLSDHIDFPSWYYKNDPTHIVFYSKKTMHWIAEKFSFDILILNEQVTVFKNR